MKQLKIKTNSLKRVAKELNMYESEKKREENRVAKLKAEMADEHDIKQAVRCVAIFYAIAVPCNPVDRNCHIISH